MSHLVRLTRHMGMTPSLIIIGAGYAGCVAARRALRKGCRVTLVNERDTFINRIRLHEVVAGARTPEAATKALTDVVPGAELVIGRVETVGEDEHRAWAQLEDGHRVHADQLVLATGSAAGSGSWDWALHHRGALNALPAGARVEVVGAGWTGLETAAEVAEQRPDLSVTLVDAKPIGHTFSEGGRAHLLATLERLGVATQTRVADHSEVAGEQPCVDHVIDCTGLAVDALAGRSGLPTTSRGQVIVTPELRVQGHQRLWACGDAAHVTGQPHLRMACATANPMAPRVVTNILASATGAEPQPFSLGYLAQSLSLGRRDGLIQWVKADDTPTKFFQRGRSAAWTKETVSRLAVPRWTALLPAPKGPR